MGYQSPLSAKKGLIEVICGCMFSGKTQALISQLHRAEIARLRIQVFKPQVDTRYSIDEVASHNKDRFPATNVSTSEDIIRQVNTYTDVVGIDEVQFFDEGIVGVAHRLADSGKRVVLAGLDTDWRGIPFGPMPKLLAIAEVIKKQYAICMICGDEATRTQRLVPDTEQFLLGSNDSYEARCRKHFDPDLSLRLDRSSQSITPQPVASEQFSVIDPQIP